MACSAGVTFGTAPSVPTRIPGTVRLAAIGDVGKGNEGQRRVADAVAQTCASRGCDLILLLGDNLYPRGMESPDDPRANDWILEPYASVGVPVFLVLGNHDYAHGRDRQRAAWQLDWAERTEGVELPAHAWELRVGPLQLLGLDTAAAFQFGARDQRRWLQQRLADTHAPWTVVAGHHPLRSNGRHGNAGAYEGWSHVPWLSGAAIERLLAPLCDRVDLYLSGHDHSRQLLQHCGVDLIVSGAGASTTPILDRGNAPRFARDTLGLVWLELTDTDGTATFIDADARPEATFRLRR